MGEKSHVSTAEWEGRIQACLDKLSAGDPTAKDSLLAIAYDRLEHRARQMLAGFQLLKGSYETNDVLHEAYIGLHKSLDAIHPENPRQFLGLVALHIRRKLIDLYRHCRGPESYEANRATNAFRGTDGVVRHYVDQYPDTGADTGDSRWVRLLEEVSTLNTEDQELFGFRFINGMTHIQIAAQLAVSEKTVIRRWNAVKAELQRRLGVETGL